MDYQAIAQIISTVGFPIVACVAMFYLYDKTVKDLTVAISRIDNTMEHILNHLEGVRVYDAKHEVKEN